MKIIFLKGLAFTMLSLSTFAFAAAPAIPQTMNYWFDECAWNGTTQQVIDHSANNLYGSAKGGADTDDVTKIIQRATYFDGVNDYVDTGRNLVELHARSASLSFWIKTAQKGSNTTWVAPAIAGAEANGITDDMYWGYIDAVGHIGLAVGDDKMVQSTSLINDDVWHHIVLTRNRANSEGKVYVDGVLEKTGTLNARLTVLAFQSIGRSENSAYYKGYLDEVEIYDGLLSATDVSAIYANELAGYNYDGTTRAAVNCTVPVANVDFYTADYQTSTSDNVMANDTGTNITAAATTGPSNGRLVLSSNGSFTYTPNAGYSGTDSFSYTVTDEFGNTSTASVTINVNNAPIVVPTNLVAEYRLDECAFDGTAGDVIDNSINRLNGTSFADTTIVEGNTLCNAALFDGTGDYIGIGDDTRFNFSPNDRLSVSFWVYVTNDSGGLISKSNDTVSSGWAFDINNRVVTFRIGDGDTNNLVQSLQLAVNTWYHIVGTYQTRFGNDMFLYVNGSEVDTYNRAGEIINSTNTLYIGRGNAGSYYNGQIDEVKIFNNELSATNVTVMYNNESVGRNWNNITTARTCNTCTADVTYTPGGNFWHLVSLQSDFRNPLMIAKTTSDVMTPKFAADDYDLDNTNPNGWIMIRRDYAVGAAPSGKNDASYHTMGIDENIEYGKAYWLGSKISNTWEANTKTMDFNVVNNPNCRSANGKCVLIDLEEPNGTNNKGSYIYTMTSFPIAVPIKWENVRILINGVAYTPDAAQALGETFNATIWEYATDSQTYTPVAPSTMGVQNMIRPYVGYWIELDKNTAGRTVQLLVPQE